MTNKGEDKREHEHEDEHDEEAETKVEDEDDSLNMNSCTKMMSDPFLASGEDPRSLLAPQGVPWTPGRHPESLSGSGTVRFRVQIRSREGPIGFEKYSNDVDCVEKLGSS